MQTAQSKPKRLPMSDDQIREMLLDNGQQ